MSDLNIISPQKQSLQMSLCSLLRRSTSVSLWPESRLVSLLFLLLPVPQDPGLKRWKDLVKWRKWESSGILQAAHTFFFSLYAVPSTYKMALLTKHHSSTLVEVTSAMKRRGKIPGDVEVDREKIRCNRSIKLSICLFISDLKPGKVWWRPIPCRDGVKEGQAAARC